MELLDQPSAFILLLIPKIESSKNQFIFIRIYNTHKQIKLKANKYLSRVSFE
jgi:hypothetical protein